MFRSSVVRAGVVMVVLAGTSAPAMRHSPQAAPASGWTIPAEAVDEKNPVAGDPKAVEAGKTLYQSKCERCHGPAGIGDGPDADPDYMAEMDLTNPKRAERNPDGVVFYKIWNGRSKPRMPALKEELTKEQIWTIVAYVQTLRKK
jgi:mono/diheme cytochrome c family protein